MLTNYCPISILSHFSKIFEKLIFNRINDYLEKYHLICDKQFGFRQNFFTSHAISNIYEKLLQNSDTGMYNCCIFLNFTKAFDTVHHDVLLYKMKNINGFRELALKLVQSYNLKLVQSKELALKLIQRHTIENYIQRWKIASPIRQKLNMVCHRILSLGHYFFFCISMIFLLRVNLTLSCLLMTFSWPC